MIVSSLGNETLNLVTLSLIQFDVDDEIETQSAEPTEYEADDVTTVLQQLRLEK